METNKYEEKAEWKDQDNCVLITNEEIPLKDGDKLVGVKSVKNTVTVGADALISNYDKRLKNKANAEAQLAMQMAEKEKLGKKPSVTAEMTRLKRALSDLSLIDKHNELEVQMKDTMSIIEAENIWLEQRGKTISQRPSNDTIQVKIGEKEEGF